MKTILLLGGSAQQVVAITKARELGYRTVLCDYLADNPGKDFSDIFYLVSTTDMEAVLDVAKKEHIDGILAYASDPAALTAAYVAEKLELPGQPYKSVEILTNKEIFRKFLKDNEFNTPKTKGFNTFEGFYEGLNKFELPILIKPTDSSGSKGISIINSVTELKDRRQIKELFDSALSFSRARVVIVEEFVNCKGYQIAGDGFSINGELVFRCFGNDHFDHNNLNPFVPVSASFPSVLPEGIQKKIHDEVQRLLSLLGMKTGAYNFDIMIDQDDKIFLMEIGPRNGGNYIPLLVQHLTGFDIISATVKSVMGDNFDIKFSSSIATHCCYYALHSKSEGKLKSIRYNDNLLPSIISEHLNYSIGDKISRFTGASSALGILLLKFDSMTNMLETIDSLNYSELLEIQVD